MTKKPKKEDIPGGLDAALLTLCGIACALIVRFMHWSFEREMLIVLAGLICVVGSMIILVIRRIEAKRDAKIAAAILAAAAVGMGRES